MDSPQPLWTLSSSPWLPPQPFASPSPVCWTFQFSERCPMSGTVTQQLMHKTQELTFCCLTAVYEMYCFLLIFVYLCVIRAANRRGNFSQAIFFTPVCSCLHFPQYLDIRIVNMYYKGSKRFCIKYF